MSTAAASNLKFELGHVLFIDIIGYSKMLITEQSEMLRKLTEVVRETGQFRVAEAEDKLVRLPTGDGMALVFRNSPEAPVQCALELSKSLKAHPELSVRMGIHSGPVNEVADVNQRTNITGSGINMAQRVMDCGDAGHILLSKHVADDLEQYPQWRLHLHELGECEVKHGARVSIVNLYTDELGNPELPEKFKRADDKQKTTAAISESIEKPVAVRSWALIGAALLIGAAIAIGLLFFRGKRSPISAAIPPPSLAPASAAIPKKSIAVLPFDNLSNDKENAYFADGVQDEILTDLARIADLKVISRSSVMQYKSNAARNLRQIGQQLGVAHLLEGSVQRASGKVRVNAQLIDARTDAHLWANTYDRELADVFAIQSEIAKTIADQLQAKILPREKLTIEKQPTKDIAAYDLYVRATEGIDAAPYSDNPNEAGLQAVSLLEHAVARDPTFLSAYCKLAQAHDQLYLMGGDHTEARFVLAEQAINTALRLQPDAPEARLARAAHLYSKLDYEGARAEIEIARRTLPNAPRAFELSGYIDRRQGRWQESARNLERALELDPNNVFILQQISTSYEALRDYAKGAVVLDRVILLKPGDFDTRINRAQLEVFWKADTKPLRELVESFMRDHPASSASLAGIRLFLAFSERDASAGLRAAADLHETTFGPDALQFPPGFAEGIFARLTGDAVAAKTSFTKARAAQQKIVDAQPDYGPALCVLGVLDAGLGRKEEALLEGRRAAELMPPSKDSVNGAHILSLLALIYAWVGEKDLAIDQLSLTVPLPSGPSYGVLRLFSQWDPLRGDPRFEQIVASLAPKDIRN